MHFAAILIASTLATAAYAQSSSPIVARLTVPDTEVLPGVPFDMWVELTNPSDSRVSFFSGAQLVVRVVGGETFEALRGDRPILLDDTGMETEKGEAFVTLEPGETRIAAFPIGPGLRGAGFFDDDRLSPPGRYELAVRFDRGPPTPLEVRNEVPPTFYGAVLSNTVSVTRIEPTGSDRDVWRLMQSSVEGGRWSQACLFTTVAVFGTLTGVDVQQISCNSSRGPLIWADIIREYPDSNYLPYAVAAREGTGEAWAEVVVETLNRFPESPASDLLSLKTWQLVGFTCGLRGWRYPEGCESALERIFVSMRPTTRALGGDWLMAYARSRPPT